MGNQRSIPTITRTEISQPQHLQQPPPSISTTRPSPPPFQTKADFMKYWFSWKIVFLEHIKSIDKTEDNKQKWNMILLNRMGPVGQEIYRTFIFGDNEEKENIDIIFKKFDYYCLLGDIKRTYEAVDKYVNNLKVIASKRIDQNTDIDKIIKEKILNEIDKDKFTNRARSLIPGFSFASSIQFLTLKEVTYIWITYENTNFEQNEIIHNGFTMNCNNCGNTHIKNECPAYGKFCNHCNNKDHYMIRCPSQYKDDCNYCGEGHYLRQCPAYWNKCYKCQTLHHFSWKCLFPMIYCKFCGFTHIARKSACFAANALCTKCYKRGHIVAMCRK